MSTPQAGLRLGKEVLTKLLAAAGLQISVVFNNIIIIIGIIIVSSLPVTLGLTTIQQCQEPEKDTKIRMKLAMKTMRTMGMMTTMMLVLILARRSRCSRR